uniref:Uncharacterized protein n=1 Tax=Arcella intermedia TaxID=1963864 RepID=A0A6B2KWQ2_9EUKA
MGDVSRFLLDHNYYLTSLELYQECIERNILDEVKDLSAFFSNQNFIKNLNYETPKKPKIQNRSFGEDLLMYQDKIRRLEEDLVIQSKTLNFYRNEFLHSFLQEKDGPEATEMTDFERRTLNYCVKMHLLDCGYKHSVIAFCQEAADEVVDCWADYGKKFGLKNYKPPHLPVFYRYFMSKGTNAVEFGHLEALKKMGEEKSELEAALVASRGEVKKLEETVSSLEKQLRFYKKRSLSELPKIKASGDSPSQPKAPQVVEIVPAPKVKEEGSPVKKETPPPKPTLKEQSKTVLEFAKAVSKRERNYGRLFGEQLQESKEFQSIKLVALKSINDTNTLIGIISESLCRIVDAVNVERRSDLLPLLLLAICCNQDENARRKLTQLLFNLIPKPDEAQRSTIANGCIWLANLSSEERVSGELLSEIQQFDSQYEERRILIAEVCGGIAPHVRPDLRLSLLLSILMHLQTDSRHLVKESAIKNIGKLLLHHRVCDDIMHFKKIQNLLVEVLKNPVTVEVGWKILIPIFTDWCEENQLFVHPFLNDLIKKIHDVTSKEKYNEPVIFARNLIESDEIKKSTSSIAIDEELQLNFKILHSSVHQLVEMLVTESLGFAKLSPTLAHTPIETLENDVDSKRDNSGGYYIPRYRNSHKDLVLQLFEETLPDILEQINAPQKYPNLIKEAPAIYWVVNTLLPKIIETAVQVDTSYIDHYLQLSGIVLELCHHCGNSSVFYTGIVAKQFLTHLSKIKTEISQIVSKNLSSKGAAWIGTMEEEVLVKSRIRLTTLYLCGVEVCDIPTLRSSFKDLILNVGKEDDLWSNYHFIVIAHPLIILCRHSPNFIDTFKYIFQELESESHPRVRMLLSKLISVMATEVLDGNQDIDGYIQILTTFVGDPQRTVKSSTVAPFGDLAVLTTSQTSLDKIKASFLLLIEQGRKIQREVLRVYAQISPTISQTFRNNVIVPELLKSTSAIPGTRKAKARKKLMNCVLSLTMALSECPMTDEMKKTFIYPSIEIMYQNISLLDGTEKKDLTDLYTAMKKALAPAKEESSSSNWWNFNKQWN